MSKIKTPEFTNGGRDLFEKIMITLGKKTKGMFVDALNEEFERTKSKEHQMMNSGDIIRVAKLMKIEIL
jgi:hypothetical protein